MPVRWQSISVCLVLIVAFVLAGINERQPAQASGDAYKLSDGPYRVSLIDDLVIDDPARDKQLEIRIYYPEGDGPFPVIVFSHGMGGSQEVGADLMAYWAGHGYVVICPTHADSIKLYAKEHPDEVDGWARDMGKRRMLKLLKQTARSPTDWENRARDITLVLDSLSWIEDESPLLRGRLDHQTIGVAGHSYGAYTTMLIGGAVLDPPGRAKDVSWGDDRADALLVMSGQGVGRLGLTEHSWDGFSLPMLVMSGTRDNAAGGMDVISRRDPYDYAPAGDKYLVWIEDALHASFTGALASGDRRENYRGLWTESVLGSQDLESAEFEQIDQPAIFDYVKTATLAYWDSYLKHDTTAAAWLAGKELEVYSEGAVELSTK
ncbi:hypothetical protein JW859_13940 [bacterium]|nr:hypothetical protein [bacterium]